MLNRTRFNFVPSPFTKVKLRIRRNMMSGNSECRDHWLKASQNKGSKETSYGRTTENKLSKEGWSSFNKFKEQREEIGEERIGKVLDKLFGDETLNEEDLHGLTQEEIGIGYAKGNIPSEIDLATFVEMIENAGIIEDIEDDPSL